MTYFPDYHDPEEGCPNCNPVRDRDVFGAISMLALVLLIAGLAALRLVGLI